MSVWRKLLVRCVPQGVKDLARDQVARAIDERTRSQDVIVLAARVEQLESVLRHEMGMTPPPPRHLQERVVGGFSPSFIDSGQRSCASMAEILATASLRFADLDSILDFGCGCGRVIRAVRKWAPQASLSGTDIDHEAIEWLQANCAHLARFDANPHRPPMRYEDDSFDFIYSISIFTHLPEDMQFEWLAELKRVARPGAHLLLTFHGAKHHARLAPAQREEIARRGFHYASADRVTTDGLPVFYQNSYHTHDYVRREWGRHFEILDIRELGLDNHQDTVLLRNSRR